MKAILLSCLFATINATIFAAQPEKAGPIKAPPPTPPHVYVNPEKVPEHDWDRDLFRTEAQVPALHLEFLYWKALEGNLTYAIKTNQPSWNTNITTPGANSAACGTYQNAQFALDPGFRIGASFFRAPHYWEIFVQYTRVTSSGREVVYSPVEPNQYLNSTWQLPQADPTNPNSLLSAISELHLNYNVADAFFTRYFQPNPHLRVRMLGGFTGAWLNQDTKIAYLDTDLNESDIIAKWKYWGAGLRFGMMADWYWFSNIYMTGRLTFAGLMGSYRNQITQTTNAPMNSDYDTSIPFGQSDYKDGRAVSNVQMVFGPSWQKAFKSTRLEVFAGCEYNMWANLQETYQSDLTYPSGSKSPWINTGILSMVGLTSRVSIDF